MLTNPLLTKAMGNDIVASPARFNHKIVRIASGSLARDRNGRCPLRAVAVSSAQRIRRRGQSRLTPKPCRQIGLRATTPTIERKMKRCESHSGDGQSKRWSDVLRAGPNTNTNPAGGSPLVGVRRPRIRASETMASDRTRHFAALQPRVSHSRSASSIWDKSLSGPSNFTSSLVSPTASSREPDGLLEWRLVSESSKIGADEISPRARRVGIAFFQTKSA